MRDAAVGLDRDRKLYVRLASHEASMLGVVRLDVHGGVCRRIDLALAEHTALGACAGTAARG
jgi:hypothetical protein